MVNEFETFAASAGATVVSQAAWEALTTILANGFGSGILPANYLNKAFRQAIFPSSQVAQFISDILQVDVRDDGNAINFEQLLFKTFLGAPILTDAGVTNALVFSPPIILSGFTKLQFVGKITNTNTSTVVTAVISGGTPIPVVLANGLVPQPGDLRSGQFYLFFYDGTNLRVLGTGPLATPAGGPTLWVRSDGNDMNDGSANTAGSAFQTIQAAISYALQRFVLGGKTLLIRFGTTGNFAAPLIPVSLGAISILGDTTNPGAYIISGNGSGNSAVIQSTGTNLTLSGVSVSNTGTTTNWLGSAAGGVLNLDHFTFLSTVANANSLCVAFGGGSFSLGAGITISTNYGTANLATNGGSIGWQTGSTLTMTGTPAASTAFAHATVNGSIAFSGTAIGGAGTGTRYLADLNGVINTFGSGVNYLPGGVAGSTATGGQYA